MSEFESLVSVRMLFLAFTSRPLCMRLLFGLSLLIFAFVVYVHLFPKVKVETPL